jgi:hypothetical protein
MVPRKFRILMTAVGALLCLSVSARAGEALPESVQACRGETDDARRLACFDRETARYLAAPAEAFALRSPAQAAPAPASMTAHVLSLRERPHDGFVATLDNGQVWVQNELDSHTGIRAGDEVTLKPAKLGGIWMTGPGGGSTKVHRIR